MFQQNQQITWLKNLSVFAPEDDVHNTEEEKDTKDLQCWKEVPPFPNMKFFYMHVPLKMAQMYIYICIADLQRHGHGFWWNFFPMENSWVYFTQWFFLVSRKWWFGICLGLSQSIKKDKRFRICASQTNFETNSPNKIAYIEPTVCKPPIRKQWLYI